MFLLKYILRKLIIIFKGTFFNKKTTLSKEEKKFTSFNTLQWKNENKSNEIVLIQGSTIHGGPNYLFRVTTIAKHLQETFSTKSMVVLNKAKCHGRKEFKLFESYNIPNIIYTKDFFSSIPRYIKAYKISKKIFKFLKTGNDLSKIIYKDILIGDFIYDDIIKFHKGRLVNNKPLVTIDKINYSYFRFIFTSIDYYLAYEEILNKHKISYLITTHSQFSEFGLLARLAYNKNITVIETTDISLTISHSTNKNLEYPSFHSTLREQIKYCIKNDITNHNSLKDKALKELIFRHEGNSQQYDVRLAYNNKNIYSDTILRDKLDINNKNPFAIIMCHIFSDAGLSGGDGMLFTDYYEWLVETIEQASKIKNINWLLKPHPASAQYKEDGVVQNILDSFPSSNIYLVPDDFSTASIKNISRAIVTARGTAGLEYSCFGIPCIMAGKSFYSDLGFTIDSTSKEEYFSKLNNINNIEKLDEEKQKLALLVYSYFNKYSTIHNDPILVPSLLNKIRGTNGDVKDLNKAYDILTDRLKNNNPKQWSHYPLLIELLKREY